MLVKNLVQGRLVNGSVGQVLRFSTAADAAKEHLEIAKVDGNAAQAASPRGARDQLWPIVRFTNGVELLMTPQEFTINNADGEMEARRDQVPLILAWALSVHKSQGQTIERVRVDLRNTFEKGQGACLSRYSSSGSTLHAGSVCCRVARDHDGGAPDLQLYCVQGDGAPACPGVACRLPEPGYGG
ncbi:hypothetical protein GGX14DRAFT_422829 [Mycena pura]|uniref:ATP-dependent DNA helicase PIF1 n=1 Tax=Mycena pura TaxID=153505 RepID=A0AAD7E336_9AGAR|nr:hypothetical protein GGX14DRAFT_422829 [Mycena pura]